MGRTPTVPAMRAHVAALSSAFRVKIVYDPLLRRHEAAACQLYRGILARPIDDVTSYVAVIHELGHLIAPNGWALEDIIAEEAAWEWARYVVEQVFEWTVEMEHVRRICLASYGRV